MKVRAIRRRAKDKYQVVDGMKFIRISQSKRCRSYVAGCVTCDEFRFLDTYGRFTRNYDELHEFMEITEGESK